MLYANLFSSSCSPSFHFSLPFFTQLFDVVVLFLLLLLYFIRILSFAVALSAIILAFSFIWLEQKKQFRGRERGEVFSFLSFFLCSFTFLLFMMLMLMPLMMMMMMKMMRWLYVMAFDVCTFGNMSDARDFQWKDEDEDCDCVLRVIFAVFVCVCVLLLLLFLMLIRLRCLTAGIDWCTRYIQYKVLVQ